MFINNLIYATCAALNIVGAAANLPEGGSSSLAPVRVLETRRSPAAPPLLQGPVLRGLHNDLVAAGIQQRASAGVYMTNASLGVSWTNAELFSYGILSVKCATCYIKGTAYASVTFADDFNVTTAFVEFIEAFGSEIKNITTEVWDEFKEWAEFVAKNATDVIGEDIANAFQGDFDEFQGIDFDAYEFPTIEVDFNVNLTDMPETTINLGFDGLELYMLLDVALAANETYTIPLYPKDAYQPAGIAIGDQELGIIISLDLILQVDAEADLSTGVHIAFDDGLSMEIAMFGKEVSKVTLTDGSFEFLPVTLNSSGLVFDATLRLGVTTGLNMSADIADIDLGVGASAQVYADLAHFRTNITPSEMSHELKKRDDTSYSDDCQLPVVESYEFGLGAQAGVFVQFESDTWGPTPETSIQIFYTTLYSACAISATTTATDTTTSSTGTAASASETNASGVVLTLGSATSVYTVTNILCQVPGLRDCPASLQSTNQTVRTSTVYGSVPSGSAVTFPVTTTTGSVLAAQAFGTNLNRVQASSGSPVSYIPPANTGGIGGAIDGAEAGFEALSDTDKRLVIGLSIGVGSALVIGLAALIMCFRKRRAAKKQEEMRSRGIYPTTSGGSYRFLESSRAKNPKWNTSSSTVVSHYEVTTRYEDTSYKSRR